VALGKKQSRLIEVDGIEYRWAFSIDSGYATIVVQHGQGSGRRLETQTGVWHWGEERAVKPSAVAAVILFAKERGWNPLERGPAFRLRGVDHLFDSD